MITFPSRRRRQREEEAAEAEAAAMIAELNGDVPPSLDFASLEDAAKAVRDEGGLPPEAPLAWDARTAPRPRPSFTATGPGSTVPWRNAPAAMTGPQPAIGRPYAPQAVRYIPPDALGTPADEDAQIRAGLAWVASLDRPVRFRADRGTLPGFRETVKRNGWNGLHADRTPSAPRRRPYTAADWQRDVMAMVDQAIDRARDERLAQSAAFKEAEKPRRRPLSLPRTGVAGELHALHRAEVEAAGQRLDDAFAAVNAATGGAR